MSRQELIDLLEKSFRACRVPVICSSCQKLLPVGTLRFFSKPTHGNPVNICMDCHDKDEAFFNKCEFECEGNL